MKYGKDFFESMKIVDVFHIYADNVDHDDHGRALACLVKDHASGVYTLYAGLDAVTGRPLCSGKSSKVRNYMIRTLCFDARDDGRIKKIFAEYRAAVDAAKNGDIPAHLHFSAGNRKTGTPSLSVPPVLTCFKRGQLPPCVRYCYALKSAMYSNVRKNDIENLIIWQFNRKRFIDELSDKLRECEYFRINVDGDIPSYEFFRVLCKIQAQNLKERGKTARVWLYSKQYRIVNQYCERTINNPESILKKYNISVLFSAAAQIVPDNPHGFPTFDIAVTEKERQTFLARGVYECPGSCVECQKAGRGCPFGENAFVMQH